MIKTPKTEFKIKLNFIMHMFHTVHLSKYVLFLSNRYVDVQWLQQVATESRVDFVRPSVQVGRIPSVSVDSFDVHLEKRIKLQ